MHPHAQTHGNLLKWNTQSLTFTSVRPHSFDRKRIQTEWNHHQRGCCAIDLSSPLCSLTDRREHWRMGWGGGLLGLNTIIVFLSLYWSARMTQRRRKRDREAEKQSERHQLQSQKWKEAGIALSSPPQQCTFENRYRRAKTMQKLPCAE